MTTNLIEDKTQAHQEAIWEEWARRLESGDYPQTFGTLHRIQPDIFSEGADRPAGFCCLGVAAELACDLGVAVRMTSSDGKYDSYRHVKDREEARDSGTLTTRLSAWLGVDRPGVRSNEGDFIMANDSREKTFPQIAAMVRDLSSSTS